MSPALAIGELRLLRIFVVLMKERSVSRAAFRMNLSQPTLSHALNRLRALFDDPLLVRASGTMIPTPRGLALQAEIEELLGRFESLVAPNVDFQPGTSRARIAIMAPEFATVMIAGPLLRRVQESAPNIEVEFVTTDPVQALEMLEQAVIDYRLGWWPLPAPGLKHRMLWTDRMCCILQAGHPLLSGPLTAAQYFDARHVRVRRPNRSYSMASIDAAAAKAGRRVQIGAYVQNAHTMSAVVATTGLLGTLSERLIERLHVDNVERRPLPFDVPALKVALYWHERTHKSPLHRWFGRLLIEVSEGLKEAPAKPRPRRNVYVR